MYSDMFDWNNYSVNNKRFLIICSIYLKILCER